MDPISIAASAASVVSIAGKVYLLLDEVIRNVRGVDEEVKGLRSETRALSTVAAAIQRACEKHRSASLGDSTDIWVIVEDNIHDCKSNLKRLHRMLKEVQRETTFKRGLFRKSITALSLSKRMKDITARKAEVQTHNTALLLALSVINIHLQIENRRSKEDNITFQKTILQRLKGLKYQIDELEQAIPTNHTRRLIRSAKDLHSTTSSTVWDGSVAGDPLTPERHEDIHNWIPPKPEEEPIPHVLEQSPSSHLISPGTRESSSSYYEVLSIPTSASSEVIEEAYSVTIALQNSSGHVDQKSRQEVNHAYYTLSDPTRRREYDRSFGSARNGSSITPVKGVEGRDVSPPQDKVLKKGADLGDVVNATALPRKDSTPGHVQPENIRGKDGNESPGVDTTEDVYDDTKIDFKERIKKKYIEEARLNSFALRRNQMTRQPVGSSPSNSESESPDDDSLSADEYVGIYIPRLRDQREGYRKQEPQYYGERDYHRRKRMDFLGDGREGDHNLVVERYHEHGAREPQAARERSNYRRWGDDHMPYTPMEWRNDASLRPPYGTPIYNKYTPTRRRQSGENTFRYHQKGDFFLHSDDSSGSSGEIPYQKQTRNRKYNPAAYDPSDTLTPFRETRPFKDSWTSNASEPTSDLNCIIEMLLSARNHKPRTPIDISTAQVQYLCKTAKEVLLSQPMLLELEAPIKVIGDIHGQYYDLLRHFEWSGPPPVDKYLLLGNYDGQGTKSGSLETVCLILAYKIKYPDIFFILRGSHECGDIFLHGGLFKELTRCTPVHTELKELRGLMLDCFDCLPIAAIIDEKMLAVHSGLSPELNSLEQLRAIQRPIKIPEAGLLCDIIWSTPESSTTGWAKNDPILSGSYTFGPDVVKSFVEKHDLDCVVRSHQVQHDGYEFFSKCRMVTVFSAPNYRGQYGNGGAIMSVDESLLCKFEVLKACLDHSSNEQKDVLDFTSYITSTDLKAAFGT